MIDRILCCIVAFFIATICHAQNFWQLTSGPQDKEINSLVTDSSGIIYQTADDAFRSTDDGVNWTKTGHPIWTSRSDLAGGKAKGTLYTLFTNGYPEGLLVSTNQGVNWTRLVTTPAPTRDEDRTIHALAVKSDSIAFLCTYGNVSR